MRIHHCTPSDRVCFRALLAACSDRMPSDAARLQHCMPSERCAQQPAQTQHRWQPCSSDEVPAAHDNVQAGGLSLGTAGTCRHAPSSPQALLQAYRQLLGHVAATAASILPIAVCCCKHTADCCELLQAYCPLRCTAPPGWQLQGGNNSSSPKAALEPQIP